MAGRRPDDTASRSHIFSYIDGSSPASPSQTPGKDRVIDSRTPSSTLNNAASSMFQTTNGFSELTRSKTKARSTRPPTRSMLDEDSSMLQSPFARAGVVDRSETAHFNTGHSQRREFNSTPQRATSSDMNGSEMFRDATPGKGSSSSLGLAASHTPRTPSFAGLSSSSEFSNSSDMPYFDSRLSSAPQHESLQHSTAFDRLETVWLPWVLVVGVSSGQDAVNSVLRQFQRFGEIVDYASSAGNWMFIKYASPLHAESAVANSLTLQSRDMLYSVQRMSSSLAAMLNMQIDVSGVLQHLESSVTTTASSDIGASSGLNRRKRLTTPGSGSRGRVGLDEEDEDEADAFIGRGLAHDADRHRSRIGQTGAGFRSTIEPASSDLYLKPAKRSSNICSKIAEFFFSY